MIRVEDQVWARWRELEHLRKPAIGLLLVSGASRRVVLRAVREAAAEAVAAFDPGDDLPDGVDERGRGCVRRSPRVWFASESMTQIRVLISPHLRGFRLHQEGVLDDRAGTFCRQ
jgi:hypothetical protein